MEIQSKVEFVTFFLILEAYTARVLNSNESRSCMRPVICCSLHPCYHNHADAIALMQWALQKCKHDTSCHPVVLNEPLLLVLAHCAYL